MRVPALLRGKFDFSDLIGRRHRGLAALEDDRLRRALAFVLLQLFVLLLIIVLFFLLNLYLYLIPWSIVDIG